MFNTGIIYIILRNIHYRSKRKQKHLYYGDKILLVLIIIDGNKRVTSQIIVFQPILWCLLANIKCRGFIKSINDKKLKQTNTFLLSNLMESDLMSFLYGYALYIVNYMISRAGTNTKAGKIWCSTKILKILFEQY